MSDPDAKWFDLNADPPEAHAFLQWKGTDACMDFCCDCGASPHVDGFFASNVRCYNCGAIWEMPMILFPRKVAEARSPVYETTAEMDGD